MTVEQMIKILRQYPRDAEVTVVTSSNGVNMDGQIGIEYISRDITAGNTGKTLSGPIIETKGRLKDISKRHRWYSRK